MSLPKEDGASPASPGRLARLLDGPMRSLQNGLPGLVLTFAATGAAAFLSDRFGLSLTPLALLIGLALNFLASDKRLSAGLSFATGPLLRLGVVALGARITLPQIMALGWPALLAIAGIVTITMISGVVLGRRLGFGTDVGLLAGAAVAICGASAALAFSCLLGRERVGQGQLALVLVGIAAMSGSAMVLYPLLAEFIALDSTQAGFLFGAAIHDVAQALGAGHAYSPEAAETAAIVKLSRVALLAPAMALAAYSLGIKTADGKMVKPPWFVVGFFAVVAINSAGLISPDWARLGQSAGTILLVSAVTATGIRSRLTAIFSDGSSMMLLILGPTLVALLLALLSALLLIG